MSGVDFLIYSVTRAYRFGYAWSLGDGKPVEDELRLSDVEVLCKKISEFGVNNLFLTGVGETGDPFVRKDIHEILRMIHDHGLRPVFLKTDGMSLREEDVRILSKYEVMVLLSMAGPKDVDNALRGGAFFERSLEIAKRLSSEEILYSLNVPLTKHIHGRISDLIELALKVKACRISLSTLIPQPLVFNREQILKKLKPLEPTPEQREEVLNQVFNLNNEFKQGRSLVQLSPYDIFYNRILKVQMPSLELETPCELHINQKRYGWLEILDNGDISTCSALGINNGNIRSIGTLCEVFDEIRSSEYVKRLINKENLVGKCKSCEYYAACAGCRARAYQYTGNPFASDPACPYVPARG